MIEFRGRVLLMGFGAVARCTLPILFKHVQVPPESVTIMDFDNAAGAAAREWVARGAKFVRDRVTQQNLGSLLGKHLGPGDLLIDLAWNIDCCELLAWCHEHGVLYINTSVEIWDPYQDADKKHPTEKTLYWRHMNVRRLRASWSHPGPTAVLEHGANPGLISHWTKLGLIDIGETLLADQRVAGEEAAKLRDLLDRRQFNELARQLGVKVIHCSERDTQITDQPKQVDEFVNTWSIEGFREEGTTTAEMGWGTHEKQLPSYAHEHKEGPRNQICLARMGINTWVRSWVPHYAIQGMVVRHGEAFTISDSLTVWEDGKAVYRPTIHYAYCPCDSAIASLQELRGYDYELQPKLRIMNDEITSGSDILGALIMGHAYNAWWTGSDLSIEESRRLVPHQNATTMQVAISVVAAVSWMIEHPARGVCVPDDLPHDYVLRIANPYLGNNLSLPQDWTPLKDRASYFAKYTPADLDVGDPWQFKNFLITQAD
jgi:homospermidine synthase